MANYELIFHNNNRDHCCSLCGLPHYSIVEITIGLHLICLCDDCIEYLQTTLENQKNIKKRGEGN